MKRFVLLCTLFICFAFASNLQAASYKLSVDQEFSNTAIKIELEDAKIYPEGGFHKVEIPNAGKTTRVGLPELPIISKLVAIPNNSDVELEILSTKERVIEDIKVYPVQLPVEERGAQREFTINEDFYASTEIFPTDLVTLSEPMIFRDFRVVQLNFYPYEYNPEKNELTEIESIEVQLNYKGRNPINTKNSVTSPGIARSFDKIYRKLIANYDEMKGDRTIIDGSLLIISHDTFMNAMEPLVEWKMRKGVPTELVSLSEIGNNPTAAQLKAYIANYYSTHPELEYILFVGDVTMPGEQIFPCFFTLYNNNETDHPFTELEGDDYFPEVHLGRLSVDYLTEAVIVANKIINYESNPSMENPDWFKSALMVGASYMVGNIPVTSPREMKRWVHQELLDFGFSQVDTVYYPEVQNDPELIAGYIDNGVSIINYRGWAGPGSWYYPNYTVPDLQDLNNGYMLPFVTSLVCGTGKFNSSTDPCFGEAWLRSGTLSNSKGAIAFYGASETVTHTAWNNTLDGGLYISILYDEMKIIGAIITAGELGLMNFYPEKAGINCQGEDCVKFMAKVYNLLGDPSLQLWTDQPQQVEVDYETEIPQGQNYYEVTVTSNGAPLSDAHVCVMKGENGGETYSHGRTDENGYISLPINSEITNGNMYLTITKANHQPKLMDITITEQNYIGYESHTSGNFDAGSTVDLSVNLKNFGTEIAEVVSATLSSDCSYITIPYLSVNYGDINPGAIAQPAESFQIEILPEIPHNYPIQLKITATDNNGNESTSQLTVMSNASDLQIVDYAIGGDGIWNAGETIDLTINLKNNGGLDATNINGHLLTYFQGVVVDNGDANFGNIPMGNQGSATFTVTADTEVYEGMDVKFILQLEGENQTNLGARALYVPLGEPSPTNPLGPSTYGYYAFDSNDTDYDEAPIYDWVEIDPEHGGSGTALNLADDGAEIIDLPFQFKFFGINYDKITINANGWISMGEADWHYFLMENAYNYYIGCQMNPKALIAPYWDNLNFPQNEGDIFYYYDSENHRFIVEWSRVGKKVDLIAPAFYVTLQAILYDSAHHQTLTGDGEILFQYHTVPEADECTIGIENYDHTDGLEYLYNTYYAVSASEITNNLAIKFTTNTEFPTKISDHSTLKIPRKVELHQNYPNPFNPSTIISYGLNEAAKVKISVYDVHGKLVKVLVDKAKSAGYHSVKWNGKDEIGTEVGSGIYFYRLETDNLIETKKMILVR